MTSNPTPDRLDAIRRRHAVLAARTWDAKPHQHGASGCRCLSCYDDPTGWQIDHPSALDCEELAASTTNDFGRARGSCDAGPLLSYEEADALAHAAEDIGFLLAALPTAPSVSAVDQTTRDRIAEALDALQGTAHHLPPKTRERVEEVMAGALARVLPSDGHATAKPMGRGVKAEALLLHFTAEAHRRKWDYDRGLDDDGQPIKSEAFDALHRLGDEMNAALHKLRATPAAVLPPPADQAAVLRDAADTLAKSENAHHRNTANRLRRLADEAQQPEPETGCAHCGSGEHSWDDCAAYTALTAEQPAVGARQPDTETPGCPDPIECSHEAALGQAESRLRLVLAVAEVIEANGVAWAADSVRRAVKGDLSQPAAVVPAAGVGQGETQEGDRG